MLVCRDPVELTIIAKTQAIGDRYRLIAHAMRPCGLETSAFAAVAASARQTRNRCARLQAGAAGLDEVWSR